MASNSPVEAPEGTLASPTAPPPNSALTETVGFPLESITCIACKDLTELPIYKAPMF